MIRYIFLVLALLANSFYLEAQTLIEPCKAGQSLVDALEEEFAVTESLSYGDARDILYAEIEADGLSLSTVYTQYTIELDPSADASTYAFNNGINAEHVYPQSMGAGDLPAKSDMHNLYPAKVNVNSSRGNCPYGEINDEETDTWYYLDMETNNIPATNIDKYSEKVSGCMFEPREAVKGNIARTVFYFYAIHHSTANRDFFERQKEILLEWHQNDPVDAQEIRRDSLVAWYQGNHNPFVLDSTLARRAYFLPNASHIEGSPDCYTSTSTMEKSQPALVINAQYDLLQQSLLIESRKNRGRIVLMDTKGTIIQVFPLQLMNHISLATLPKGIYLLSIQSANNQQTLRILHH